MAVCSHGNRPHAFRQNCPDPTFGLPSGTFARPNRDRWTLLIVRDLILARARFKDFSASPEHIPTNILSDRLARLMKFGVVEQIPAAEPTKGQGYQLTQKGEALRPILKAVRDWG